MLQRAFVLVLSFICAFGCSEQKDSSGELIVLQGDQGPTGDTGVSGQNASGDAAISARTDGSMRSSDATIPPGGDGSMGSIGDMMIAGPDMMPQEVDVCEQLGLPRVPLQVAGTGYNFGDVAEPFRVTTLNGSWSMADTWSGCESFVFLTYFSDLRSAPNGPWAGDVLWGSGLEDIFRTGPRNVQYFFVSYEADGAARTARMEAQKRRFEESLTARVADEDERDFWRRRVHFVTDRVTLIEGGVGDFFRDYMNFLFTPSSIVDLGDRGRAQPPLPFAFGIDREQLWDSVGSLSPVVGQNSQWGMSTFAGHFYNHKAELLAKVAREVATIVPVIDEMVTDRHLIRTVTLPDAETMATFNRLEIDINVTCPHRNVFGCSEWDRIGRVQYCSDEACTEAQEIVRWITPYWRRGHRRWIIDATPFLSLMNTGGEHSFRLIMGPNWERGTERYAKFDLRLSTVDGVTPMGVEKVYSGGGFNAEYNMNHGPVTFTVPPSATRAELVTIVSGHGQDESTNCSEWCDHRHQFSVNGNDLPVLRSEIPIGTLRGCADKAYQGVPPGQYGNWAPGRAFWCPGWPVDAIRADITEFLSGGDMDQLTYSASMAGREPGGGNIDLSVYVVWYTD